MAGIPPRAPLSPSDMCLWAVAISSVPGPRSIEVSISNLARADTFRRVKATKYAVALGLVACIAVSCSSGTAVPPTGSLDSVQLDDVWTFQQASQEGNDATLTGTVEIRNGCLYVGDAVVVWDRDQLSRAEQLIATVRSGEEPEVSLGGREVSLDDGESQIPAAITGLCPTDRVLYTSPTP